jgi:hypothetical protein
VVNAPFVYLGVRRDPWKRSLVDYAALESGLASTFFVIPFEGRPGINPNNGVSKKRAARYSLEDIGPELRTLRDAGCELGVHGIDAWADPSSGRAEFERLSKVAGSAALGVRMHWLYFNEASPKNLEEAGFQFDSTMGYNQTVGFKAGTTQPFRPLGTSRLMELPLHIMDTALFYPDYLDLDEDGARGRVAPILDHVAAQGGVLTVNWHDRSIAPERMWVPFYKWLLAELRHRGAWFATASRAVNWARARRQTTFRSVAWNGGTVRLTCDLPAESHEGLPGMRVRLHPARPNSWAQPTSTSAGRRPFVDVPLQSGELSLSA